MEGSGKVLAAVIASFALTASAIGTARADKCVAAKLKAIGNKEGALLVCSAKEAMKGVDPSCRTKAVNKFTGAYNKPVGCSTPPVAQCESIADDCQAQLRAALPDGNGTTPSKCEASRLKAAAKKAKAKLGCYAKAAKKDIPVDTACLAKAETKFASAYNKVSGCATDGAAASTEALIDSACVNAIVSVDNTGRVTGICATTTTTTTTSTTTTTAAPCNAPQACHDPCTVGAPQCPSCSACAAAVCDMTQDPSCCNPTGDGWTNLCASMVPLVCQIPCN
jgi:hypothetical protein